MNDPPADSDVAALTSAADRRATEDTAADDPWRWTWGAALLAIAATFALWSLMIEAPRVGGEHDLGPRAFPWLLCLGLALCGVYEWSSGLRIRGRHPRPTSDIGASPGAAPTDQHLQWSRVLLAATAVTICLLAIGLLRVPYSAATFALAVALMRLQGASWTKSFVGALLLVLWIKWMFGWGFGVQLEDGWIDRLAFRLRAAS